ncbi:MAG: ribonuclease HIII [Candidatus Melainabacteria bacterium]
MSGPSGKWMIKSPAARRGIKADVMTLPGAHWQEKREQYCDYRLDGTLADGWARIKQYAKGTLYVEASSPAFWQGLENAVKQHAGASAWQGGTLPGESVSAGGGADASGKLDISGAYIGTDESGKGDYLGPLVVAGVVVDDDHCAALEKLGVTDSKKLTDMVMMRMAGEIQDIVGENGWALHVLMPATYNATYDQFKSHDKNLNHMLADLHASIISELSAQNPDCTQAVVDQFGSEQYVLTALKQRKCAIARVQQTPRAEANLGVAAASVLARVEFVAAMRQLSLEHGMNLPLGAGSNVVRAAKEFIARHGRNRLGEVAKLHFKTTQTL